MQVESVLEGTTGRERGGLLIRKRDNKKDEEDKNFKKPSILGLDKLAKSKRELTTNLRKRQVFDEEIGNETPGLTESVREEIKRFFENFLKLRFNCFMDDHKFEIIFYHLLTIF